MPSAIMLNPVTYQSLVSKYGDMKKAAREWKKLKSSKSKSRAVSRSKPRADSPTKKGGRTVAKKRSKRRSTPAGVRSTTLAGKKVNFRTPMPKEWVSRWKSGYEDFLSQPMAMTPAWRSAWGESTLARGPVSALAKARPRRWSEGVRRYASQPLDIAGSLREVATAETLGHVVAAAAGVTAPTVAPMLLEKVLARPITGLLATAVGAGSGVVGFLALSASGKPALARTYLAGSLGGILARIVMERAMPAMTSGLGQVAPDVRKAIEAEVSQTLAQEGLGQLTVDDMAELSGLGQLTATDLDELEGASGLE